MMKRFILTSICLIILFCIVGCSGSASDSYFKIQFIDVGQGDSAIIECDGHYMLIDGGPEEAGDKVYRVLEEQQITKLDILAISHLHEDHIGGLIKALTYVSRVNTVISNKTHDSTKVFERFENQLNNNRLKITIPDIGTKYKLGSAEVEVFDVSSQNSNDSLVLLITYRNTTFLFTGDIDWNTESKLCGIHNDDFPITFLKVSHHGSDTSTSIRFLRMLMPKYAVISVGKGYGHPDQVTIDRLEQADVVYYRTDRDGDILVASDGNNISIKTHNLIG